MASSCERTDPRRSRPSLIARCCKLAWHQAWQSGENACTELHAQLLWSPLLLWCLCQTTQRACRLGGPALVHALVRDSDMVSLCCCVTAGGERGRPGARARVPVQRAPQALEPLLRCHCWRRDGTRVVPLRLRRHACASRSQPRDVVHRILRRRGACRVQAWESTNVLNRACDASRAWNNGARGCGVPPGSDLDRRSNFLPQLSEVRHRRAVGLL